MRTEMKGLIRNQHLRFAWTLCSHDRRAKRVPICPIPIVTVFLTKREGFTRETRQEIIQTAKTYNFRRSHLPRGRSYRRTQREKKKGGEWRIIIDTIGKYRNTVPAGKYRGDQFRGIHINFRCVVDPPCETAVRFLLLLRLASWSGSRPRYSPRPPSSSWRAGTRNIEERSVKILCPRPLCFSRKFTNNIRKIQLNSEKKVEIKNRITIYNSKGYIYFILKTIVILNAL